MKKLIFIDIDGTLMSHKTGVSSLNKQAIIQATQNGHLCFICTGRAKSVVDDEIQSYPFAGFIYGAGSQIEVFGEKIFEQNVSFQKVKSCFELFDSLKTPFVMEGPIYSFADPIGTQRFMAIMKDTPEVIQKTLRHHIPMERFKTMDDYFSGEHQVQKILVHAASQEQVDHIRQQCADELTAIINPNKFVFELVINNINKAIAMQKICHHLNAPIESTVAIGDSFNDLEIIKAAAIGIAMENASDEVKQAADWVTQDVENDGVFHAFKTLKLI